jgi:Flp pilus assembly protein TadG
MMNRRDRGQASIMVMMVATVLCASLAAATVGFGGHLIDRSRAQTAADAAALASLTGGGAAARSFAERHGGSLVAFIRGPGVGEVTVVVRVGNSTATAAATDAP